MGYRKVPTIHTLDKVGEEDGLVVRLKSIKFGKLRKLMRLTDADETADEALGEIFDLMLENIVSWNLEDEQGTPVPLTAEGLEDQETDLIMDIIEAWIEKMTGSGESLGKDSPSGESFPGKPMNWEIL
jgi:hypothetical protein